MTNNGEMDGDEETMIVSPSDPAIVVKYQIKVSLGEPISPLIEFATTLSRDCPQRYLDELMDKARKAAERQKIMAEIAKWKQTVMLQKADIEKKMSELAAEDEDHSQKEQEFRDRGGRQRYVRSKADQTARRNAEANLGAARAEVVRLQNLIRTQEAQL